MLLATQALQPSEDLFNAHMSFKPYNDVVVYPEHHEFVEQHRLFNQIILEVADEFGAWSIDNDKALAGDRSYFSDFVHYSDAGLERLAQSYVEFLMTNNLVH